MSNEDWEWNICLLQHFFTPDGVTETMISQTLMNTQNDVKKAIDVLIDKLPRNLPPLCKYYLSDSCRIHNCKNLHRYLDVRALCRFWLKGHCSRGDECYFAHSLDDFWAELPESEAYESEPYEHEEDDVVDVLGRASLEELLPELDDVDLLNSPQISVPSSSVPLFFGDDVLLPASSSLIPDANPWSVGQQPQAAGASSSLTINPAAPAFVPRARDTPSLPELVPPAPSNYIDLSTRMQLDAFRQQRCSYLTMPQLTSAWTSMSATQQQSADKLKHLVAVLRSRREWRDGDERPTNVFAPSATVATKKTEVAPSVGTTVKSAVVHATATSNVVKKGGVAPQMWVETGDSVAALYAEVRAAAEQHARARNAFFEQSQAAYRAGDGRLAKELGQKGRHHDEQMRAQHRLAFDKICEMRGMGSGGVANFPESADGLAWTVDCHALHPDEAVDFCSRAIEALSERVQSSTSRRRFADLICGTGHHSHDGRSKVRDAVSAHVSQLGLKIEERGAADKRGGTLRVALT